MIMLSILLSLVLTASISYALWRWTNFFPWYQRNTHWIFVIFAAIYILGMIDDFEFFPWIFGVFFFGMMAVISWRTKDDRN